VGGSLSNAYDPTVGLSSCTFLRTASDNNHTRPQHRTQTHNKHHDHHGGRAANRCGASLGGAQSNIFNPTLRLSLILVYISLVLVYIRRVTTTRRDGTKSTNNRQTPSPWWWSRSPLQRRGFDEPTLPEGWAALRMLVPIPPSKRFNRFNKLM
jgi:hypothetical protein